MVLGHKATKVRLHCFPIRIRENQLNSDFDLEARARIAEDCGGLQIQSQNLILRPERAAAASAYRFARRCRG
jgi:hypothetical protein